MHINIIWIYTVLIQVIYLNRKRNNAFAKKSVRTQQLQ